MRKRGLTTRSLATAVSVSNGTVFGWANGARPRPEVASRLAAYFEVVVDDLLDDSRDLPPDEIERRYAEAKGVAEHYPADNQTARQLAFEKHLERSSFAKTLRDTAKRLRDEAERLDQIADVLHVQAEKHVTPAVAAKVDEARRLRLEAEAKRQAGDVSYRTPPARASGT